MNPNSEAARLIVELASAARMDRGRFLALRKELAEEVEEANDVLRIADRLLESERMARSADEQGNAAEAQSFDLIAERWGVELYDIAQGLVCEGCGEPGTSENPLEHSVISPPVSGYRFERALAHESCAAEMAREMVR